MERRFNCIYIKFVIIQHLCVAIESDIIRGQVQESMYKEKSWTSSKSTNDIKIINKILLQYYHHIFRSSFGYGIFKGKCLPLCAPELTTFFRKYEII